MWAQGRHGARRDVAMVAGGRSSRLRDRRSPGLEGKAACPRDSAAPPSSRPEGVGACGGRLQPCLLGTPARRFPRPPPFPSGVYFISLGLAVKGLYIYTLIVTRKNCILNFYIREDASRPSLSLLSPYKYLYIYMLKYIYISTERPFLRPTFLASDDASSFCGWGFTSSSFRRGTWDTASRTRKGGGCQLVAGLVPIRQMPWE